MTALTDSHNKVVIPGRELVVTVTSWETMQRRERLGNGMMWTFFVADINGIDVHFKCLLDIGPIEPAFRREPRKVELEIEDGHFTLKTLFVGNSGTSGNPWAFCLPTS